jgi:dCTP deaminase
MRRIIFYYEKNQRDAVLLLSDVEILGAIKKGEIIIENFNETSLQPASYDLRLGKRGLVTKSISIQELKEKISKEELKEANIEKDQSITIPAGSFALVTSLESLKFSTSYAGHLGAKSYYTRKELALLSGLQVDPGFEGTLVLGFANLSPRAITIEYEDPICTLEIHKLSKPASKPYSDRVLPEQKEGKIPIEDKDYLRTIETMSISDLTQALVTLSNNVANATKTFRWMYPTLVAAVFAAIASVIGILVMLLK